MRNNNNIVLVKLHQLFSPTLRFAPQLMSRNILPYIIRRKQAYDYDMVKVEKIDIVLKLA